MSAIGRYTALARSGRVRMYGELPMTEFTVGEIAELFRDGLIYYQRLDGRWSFRCAVPLEDL